MCVYSFCRDILLTFRYEDTKRYYGKDVTCPKEWIDWLNNSGIPSDVLPYGSNDLLKHVPENKVCSNISITFFVNTIFYPRIRNGLKPLCVISASATPLRPPTKISAHLQARISWCIPRTMDLLTGSCPKTPTPRKRQTFSRISLDKNGMKNHISSR